MITNIIVFFPPMFKYVDSHCSNMTGHEVKLRELCDDLLGPVLKSKSGKSWQDTVLVCTIKMNLIFKGHEMMLLLREFETGCKHFMTLEKIFFFGNIRLSKVVHY